MVLMNQKLANLNHIIVIVDASESALPYWDAITQTISRLLTELPAEVFTEVYLIGSSTQLPADQFIKNETHKPAQRGSFVAPIMQQLKAERRRVSAIVIVGNGPIFDLADWASSVWVERWLLIRTGSDTMISATTIQNITEVGHTDWAGIKSILTQPVIELSITPRSPVSVISHASNRWEIDQTGYPLVYVPAIDGYWSLFPVTKPQFEYYLCQSNSDLDDVWYQTLLDLNPRASFQSNHWNRYERLLLTGLIPEEARAFARWQGSEYDIPSVKEWRAAYRWLANQAVALPPSRFIHQLAPSAQAIWWGLYWQLRPHSLLDLSLMVAGVLEWVTDKKEDRLLGKPRPYPSFRQALTDPLNSDPVCPIDPSRRMAAYGMRLMKR